MQQIEFIAFILSFTIPLILIIRFAASQKRKTDSEIESSVLLGKILEEAPESLKKLSSEERVKRIKREHENRFETDGLFPSSSKRKQTNER